VDLPHLWLASSSPRRSQLLTLLGLTFDVVLAPCEEALLVDGSVEKTVLENASRKARCLAPPAGTIVIAADTLVALDGDVISKPATVEEATRNLERFSGRSHRVLTGLALAAESQPLRVSLTETKVWFRKLGPEEIRDYVLTKEPYDKAGGYGIQGVACLFVDRVEGSFSNVMGLPTEKLLLELAAFTGVSPFQWLRA
jgi:septum formation protein